MTAEIIAVGSELLTPQRVDTNSLFLTDQLNGLGVEVVTKSVIGDDLNRLADAVRRAVSRSEIVVLCGGLGPTEDDLTRDAVAVALDRKLVYHPEITAVLEQRFAQLKRKMVEVNKRQAFVVEGAEILPNDRGTAPGQWIDDSDSHVMLLPGPPHEMKAMFTRQCLPRLARVVPRQAIRTLVLRVTGMPESDLDQLIAPVYKKYDNPTTTILAAAGDLQIHLRARCSTEGEALALLAEVGGPIELLLGDRIYSRNGQSLEEVVGDMLRERHNTLSVAESCTGGLLGERITSVPGSSTYFLGGFITYASRMKVEWLGVPEETIAEFGAVSKETAEAMALGARRRTGSTYSLAITGVAGPDPGGENAPVGTIYVGLADPAGCQVLHRQFIGGRPGFASLQRKWRCILPRRKCV